MINLHVLLAADELDIGECVAASLATDPFFVLRSCTSGKEALKVAVDWRPDLVLLDVAMPDMDGPAVLARLRSDPRTTPIPVVFLTGPIGARRREHLRRLGAAGTVAKTFDGLDLAAELRQFVALEGILAPARDDFFQRLRADAGALSACRPHLTQAQPESALLRINRIAHSLAGAGGIYGFAGITCASAALSDAAEGNLKGHAQPREVERALDRLLERIGAS